MREEIKNGKKSKETKYRKNTNRRSKKVFIFTKNVLIAKMLS